MRMLQPDPGHELTYSDPEVARIGVKSVIDAYMRSYGEQDIEGDSRRLKILEDRRSVLGSELQSLKNRILSLANEYGSDDLGDIYQFKLNQMLFLVMVLIQ